MAETPLRSRQAPALAPARSSHRASPERAPRLRRIADFIESQADQAAFPARVARDGDRGRRRGGSRATCGDRHELQCLADRLLIGDGQVAA
jgi:hypothetical protein